MTKTERDAIADELEAAKLTAEVAKQAQQYDIREFIQHIIDENDLHDIARINVSTPSYPGVVPEVDFINARTCIGDRPAWTDIMFKLQFDILADTGELKPRLYPRSTYDLCVGSDGVLELKALYTIASSLDAIQEYANSQSFKRYVDDLTKMQVLKRKLADANRSLVDQRIKNIEDSFHIGQVIVDSRGCMHEITKVCRVVMCMTNPPCVNEREHKHFNKHVIAQYIEVGNWKLKQ